ncbi:MerR family transcriptional regulator [Mobilicoccus pelagius]|uniref:Putative MerR family transcriptional regulator n=1 Tax=Mobilicoccus pelagius NBRC 104925 TaxID=1089455 RepID=H5UT38_9MICO|nr:MerR family transcriptional regulator [Mobilicoccus pelagius]GAB48896.1 putative MerR family transcriptional regulator [Mobilicoccus pelagius NBRC 104925]
MKSEERAGTSKGTTPRHTPGYVTPPERGLAGAEMRDVDPVPRFRIGEVAARIGLSLRSIRYYEETGLITPSARTSGGFRMYSEVDVQRLLTIMQMKPLGFTLERMREILADLDVLRDPDGTDEARREAHSRLDDLNSEMHAALVDLAQQLEIATQFTSRLDDELAEFPGA